MSKKNNLLVASSGTGGHIFPALAVSKEVEDEWNIHWLGLRQRLDANFIPKKYNLRTLNIIFGVFYMERFFIRFANYMNYTKLFFY